MVRSFQATGCFFILFFIFLFLMFLHACACTCGQVEITDLQWLRIYVEGVQMPFAGDAYQGIVCLELI